MKNKYIRITRNGTVIFDPAWYGLNKNLRAMMREAAVKRAKKKKLLKKDNS
jgi:hypothetical protein